MSGRGVSELLGSLEGVGKLLAKPCGVADGQRVSIRADLENDGLIGDSNDGCVPGGEFLAQEQGDSVSSSTRSSAHDKSLAMGWFVLACDTDARKRNHGIAPHFKRNKTITK